jgi:hypothetical protein
MKTFAKLVILYFSALLYLKYFKLAYELQLVFIL